jgi:hypothetical protein
VRITEGEHYTAYFEGWTLDCEIPVWTSADGQQHQSCNWQTWARRKGEAVKEMRRHIREEHREAV